MENNKLAFQKINYILMLAGIGVLVLGFVLMSMENAEYGFGSLGLTVGPITIMTGLGIEFFAIMHRPKK